MESGRLITIIFLGIALLGCQKKFQVEKVDIKIEPHIQLVENGKRLTLSICGPCHYNPESKDLSGKPMLDVPKIIGKVYASNLTNQPEFGAGNYTPGELKFLLRTGIKKNGEFSPYMAKPSLADEDLNAIIAFLKSEDDLVKATSNEGSTQYTPLGHFVLNRMFDPYDYRKEEIKRPQPSDTVALGKYLVDITGCYECHSSNMLKTNRLVPEMSKGYLGGGARMKTASGNYIKTPNLTFDETGIKNWTGAEFERALRYGINKKNKVLAYPMPNYSSLTSLEIEAIYKYLQTVPKIQRRVTKNTKKTDSFTLPNGQELYQKYSCVNCHGASGKGVADLTQAYLKYNDSDLKNRIKSPPKHSGMPAFDGVINEEEYPFLIDYIKKLGEKSKEIQSARK